MLHTFRIVAVVTAFIALSMASEARSDTDSGEEWIEKINSMTKMEYVAFLVAMGQEFDPEAARKGDRSHVIDYLIRELHADKFGAMNAFEKRRFRSDLVNEVLELGKTYPDEIELSISFDVALNPEYSFGDETNPDLRKMGFFHVCVPYEVVDVTTARGAKAFPAVQIVWPSRFSGGRSVNCDTTTDGRMRSFPGRFQMPDDTAAEAVLNAGGRVKLTASCVLRPGGFSSFKQGSSSVFAVKKQGVGLGCQITGDVTIQNSAATLVLVSDRGSELFGRIEDVTSLRPYFSALVQDINEKKFTELYRQIEHIISSGDAKGHIRGNGWPQVLMVARHPYGADKEKTILCLRAIGYSNDYAGCGEINAIREHSDVVTPGTSSSTEIDPAIPGSLDDDVDGNLATTTEDEAALKLNRATRREIQRRLSLSGFNPNGIDGIFGPGSRSAISAWQTSEKYEPTGFLNEHQVIALKSQTESAFQSWRASNPPKKVVKPTKVNGFTTVRGPNGQLRYRGADGCLRERPINRRGAIILGISKYCNQRAFGLK